MGNKRGAKGAVAVTLGICIAIILRVLLVGQVLMAVKVVQPVKQPMPEEKKSFTIMVYMIGSDLETDGACATEDLNEMIEAGIGENVTVAVQTGGAKYWHNNKVSAGTCQRFVIENNDIVEKDNLGRISMVEPESVSDFIKWTGENCQAERYALIFWNHGGGAAMGFGYDEYFSDGELMLDDVEKALDDGGIHMDFIGFDACLMAGVETAMAVSEYADYLVASEETEPGDGWYYTKWLSELEKEPDMDTEKICRNIVDEYMDCDDMSDWDVRTLSVMNLAKIDDVYGELCDFMAESKDLLDDNGYRKIIEARSDAKSYGESGYDQIDIVDYVSLVETEGKDDLTDAISEAVVYNRSNIDEACGLSMYYPYNYLDYYQNTMQHIDDIMNDSRYREFMDIFVNIVAYTSGDSGETEYDYDWFNWSFYDDDYSQYDWYDASIGEEYTTETEKITDDDLEFVYKDGQYLLELSDEQWEMVSQLELQVFLDDGDGYIDLGSDNLYEFDEYGNLPVDFDYEWVALDGMVVPFYTEELGTKSDGSIYSYGYVPAELNGETDIQVMVYWDENNFDGIVTGYYIDSYDSTAFPSRSIIDFEEGDEIRFYYDYYDYNGNYVTSYYVTGDDEPSIIYDGDIYVSYEAVANYNAVICYCIEDIYLNRYWTEFIEVQYP